MFVRSIHVSKTRIEETLLPPFPEKSRISAILLTPDLFLINQLDTCLHSKHHLKQAWEQTGQDSSLAHFVQSQNQRIMES